MIHHTTALSMVGISKSFGPTHALRDVDLQVREGEVHALVGENGAGKSTLMKILSGAIKPDMGSMKLLGEPYHPPGPLQARSSGVAMIYQELTLAPHLSVEDNITLGRTPFGLLNRKRNRIHVERSLELLEHSEISPTRLVGTLSPAASQLVEIARALSANARVLVMDEPTSSLSSQDSDRLFRVIERLRDRGVSIIYISHFLDELKRVCDRYTVLRDGQTVGSGSISETSHSELIELMVGRKLKEIYPRVPHEIGDTLAEVTHLKGQKLPEDATLTLRRGDIIGLFGLVGAGRTELLRALFGLDVIVSGEVRLLMLKGKGRSPRNRLSQGIGLLSENRKEEGLALGMSIAENLTLSRHETFSRCGLLNRRRQKSQSEHWIDKLSVKCHSTDQSVGELSGGNQQKIALGRLLHHDAEIFLLDEPTRGIDVGSKVEIYQVIGELAARGRSVVVVSSYLPELLGICDHIAVMCRGLLGPARPTASLLEKDILAEATATEL